MTDTKDPNSPRTARPQAATPPQLLALGELARGIGIATRSVVKGVNRLVGVCGLPSNPPQAKQTVKVEAIKTELERLARELLDLTSATSPDEPGRLLAQHELWLLLAKLQTLRAKLPLSERPGRSPQPVKPHKLRKAAGSRAATGKKARSPEGRAGLVAADPGQPAAADAALETAAVEEGEARSAEQQEPLPEVAAAPDAKRAPEGALGVSPDSEGAATAESDEAGPQEGAGEPLAREEEDKRKKQA